MASREAALIFNENLSLFSRHYSTKDTYANLDTLKKSLLNLIPHLSH